MVEITKPQRRLNKDFVVTPKPQTKEMLKEKRLKRLTESYSTSVDNDIHTAGRFRLINDTCVVGRGEGLQDLLGSVMLTDLPCS